MPYYENLIFSVAWFFEHLSGRKGHSGLALKNHKKTVNYFARKRGQHLPLPEYSGVPSRIEFQRHLRKREPIIMRDAAAHWPAFKKWNFDFLSKNYGDINVPSLDPEKKPDSRYEEESLKSLILRIQKGEKKYCKFSDFLYRAPKLMEDLYYSELDVLKPRLSVQGTYQFFIGPSSINTRLHNALGHNFFTQITGEKTWKIYPAYYTPLFLPKLTQTAHHISDDEFAFPHTHVEFKDKLNYWEAKLSPGDILYNPSFCWHTVESPTESIAVKSSWASKESLWTNLACSFVSLAALGLSFSEIRRLAKKKEFFPYKDWI
jgi:hypothetical protein